MPGFSQTSYDRIHGFKFSKIKANIEKIIKNARMAGFNGYSAILYHVYQFNLNEIEPARIFAKRLNIDFDPHLAIINEWDKMEAFVENRLSYNDLLRMSQELFLYKFNDTIPHTPKNYTCPYGSILAIDESCNVLICCHSPKYNSSFVVGNLLKDNILKILADKMSNSVCKKCVDTGLAYYINNSSESIYFGNCSNNLSMKFYNTVKKLINKL
jgi:hypothetical protein